ncbi:MAG: DEAD/DEAH box helicase [Myxococcota bacterium]
MSDLPCLEQAPAGLGPVLREAGFRRFTSIQQAILDPRLSDRDLRVSSQTGSGKTVALGLVMAETVAGAPYGRASRKVRGPAAPIALLVAPTRELAAQLGRELTWLYAALPARVVVVTGGTSVFQERSELAKRPQVVIGTPGRLLDHLRAGAMTLDDLHTLALDEADEMLDMNFEEELDGILGYAPETRRTHLVSATFSTEVVRLADKLQQDPVSVQGTALGEANQDIDHVLMRVAPTDRVDAAVNVLLRHPGDKTLLFVRTRAQTVALAAELSSLGLAARALHGEMTQRERTATFSQFRSGSVRFLVATDVAARGLDVQDIRRVIQVDLPDNGDVFTHRSGRTGRAGRRGTNVMFAAARAEQRVRGILRQAGVKAQQQPIPTSEEILAAADARLRDDLVQACDGQAQGVDSSTRKLAQSLLSERSPAEVVAWLLSRDATRTKMKPRDVRDDAKRTRSHERKPRKATSRARFQSSDRANGDFVTYQVSWGAQRGADTRRLLAMVCRRGDIASNLVGAIRVAPKSSTVDIAASAAKRFERSVARPDKRNPHARFRRWNPVAAQRS